MATHQIRVTNLKVLDAVRGLAALYVVLGHMSSFLWDGSKAGTLAQTLRGSVQYGNQAVLVFFLVSGFCIHHRQANYLARAPSARSIPFDSLDFFRRRWRRLFPTLALAIVVTGCFDALGVRFSSDLYSNLPMNNGADPGVVHSWQTLFAGLAFQGTLVAPVFGSNGPLWSLSYEFWFYAAYPLLLRISSRRGAVFSLFAAGVLSMLALGVAQIHALSPVRAFLGVASLWVVWVTGAVIADAYVGRCSVPGLRWLAVAAVLAIAGLMVHAPTTVIGATATQILWGAALSGLLAWLLLGAGSRFDRAISSLTMLFGPLGTISYSLYVVHFPLFVLIVAAWSFWFGGVPSGLELGATGTLLALALGTGAWFAVERHFVSARASSGGAEPAINQCPVTQRSTSTLPAHGSGQGLR